MKPGFGNIQSIFSASQYWAHQSEVLFFAWDNTDILNKVVGGQLPNQKVGATDYLTITGTGLDARYRTPNTTAYKNADNENCFWKTDGSESICDGNRLIAYDFSHIIVFYLNIAPYTIKGIMILSSTIATGAKQNKMRDDFNLSIWWSNVLSLHGAWKGNRGDGQSVWSPETVIVPVVSSAQITQVNQNKVAITFDNALDESSVPATTAFTLAGKTINNVAISGTVVTLTVTANYLYGDTVTVSYTKPGSNQLKAATGGNDVASFTSHAVTNNILYPSILDDGHTKAFYDSTDLDHISKDAGTGEVTAWSDKISGGVGIASSVAGTYPIWSATGILFDGVNDQLQSNAWTLVQPISMYVVCRQKSWTNARCFFDGKQQDTMLIQQLTTTPQFRMYAGVSLGNRSLTLDTFGILRLLYKGASSKMQINEAAALIGDAGNSFDPNGFNLGCELSGAGGAAHSNVEYKGIIIRDIEDTSENNAIIFNFVKTKYGVTY